MKYSPSHWALLRSKRERAIEIIEEKGIKQLEPVVYGSVARGDVDQHSDIDIAVLRPNILWLDRLTGHHKFIVQATPSSTPKAYISLDSAELEVISFPLSELSSKEYEFFAFGGTVDYEDLKKNVRKPGVNKRLVMIVPNREGHEEIPVEGNEEYVSKLTGTSISTVLSRERLLLRRRLTGHTGVFLKYELGDETFEEAIAKLSKRSKFFRRALDA
ncbi:nucleotidyltransferase domain-containing protein [Sulfodiicoccus acidiphilus]|nr:nucleotidyltransferase domain-containing protein [Sulfodiicoccus acidiphilus]